MYPKNKKPISGINSFLNKQFGVPLPSNNSSYGISGMQKTNNPLPGLGGKGPLAGLGGIGTYTNPSATNTKPVVIAPPVEKLKTGQFGNQGQYTYNIDAKGAAYGAPINNPNLPPAGQQFVQNLAPDDVSNKYNTATETPVTPTTPIIQPESPYKKYLDSMTSDAERVVDIQNQSEAKELEARRLYEETLDKPGGYVSGAREAAGLVSRRSNAELADLALRESAAARTAGLSRGAYEQAVSENQPIEVGGVLYQKQTDGSYKAVAGGVSTGGANDSSSISTAYADAVLSGKTKLENIPEEYRGAVAMEIAGQEITQETSPYLAQIAVQGKQAVKGLLDIATSNPSIFGKSAAAPIPTWLRSDDFRNYEAQLDYLRGNLIPASLTAMREASKTGGALGQVSDREGAWLASALGALSMNQSASEVQKQLKLIDESLSRWEKAVETYGKTSNKQTGEITWDNLGD